MSKLLSMNVLFSHHFREANALAKFVAPLRSFVLCNNKKSLPDSIRDVWRKDVVFVYVLNEIGTSQKIKLKNSVIFPKRC